MRAYFFCVHGETYPHGKIRSGTRGKERYKLPERHPLKNRTSFSRSPVSLVYIM
ncbi:hypothetical protein HMPREF3038_03039 [Akkermansia sp. KLE1797]|nr:hypothetical protein HMPREF3038_03039 [Akkermansia sp. KLE1797]KXU53780.1 hypothetical protein HMPREF3039_02024 [Akkermansia sp. KLE1798]KZA03947.1 hypothetical protein HMPREF1326_02362 [Akkermansia sp. KLE1605]